jgi:hypothetical protein
MSTLQSANQYRQGSWSLKDTEEGHSVQNQRQEGRKAKRTKYQGSCSRCSKAFESESKNQKFCSHECFAESLSERKKNPYTELLCISCLAGLGMGSKSIARRLYRVKHPRVRYIIKKRGLPRSSSKLAANRLIERSTKIKSTKIKSQQEIYRQNELKKINKSLKIIKSLKRKCELIMRAQENYGPGFDWRSVSDGCIRYWADVHAGRERGRQQAKIYKNNPKRRIKAKLRGGVNRMLMKAKQKKSGRLTTSFLGTTLQDAINRIQSKFKKGMNWSNHGTVWEIDHIMPLSSFDFSDDKNLKIANHISNLQPLFIHDNRKKSAKIPHAFQFEFL